MIKGNGPGDRLPGSAPPRVMASPSRFKCRAGFTLIEMVAVLAVLGLITALALPRYFNVMHEAKYKIAQAAVAEGHARVNLWGMSRYLTGGVWPTVDQYVAAADAIGGEVGEFVLSYKKEDEMTLKISAKGKESTTFRDIKATLRITPPGCGGE